MSTKEILEGALERIRTSASVKTVYGEPVKVDGKTIIPVAKVAYGFGGGAGMRKKEAEGKEGEGAEAPKAGEGFGGGGGVAAKPVGVVEISDQETKFVPFAQTKKLGIAALLGAGLGLGLGLLVARRRE